MALTRHGHQIPNTTCTATRKQPVARCGGIQYCKACKTDVLLLDDSERTDG